MAEPRKFYIIGHNPNSVHEAVKCLKAGANALEPDVHYLPEYDEKFFVYDLATENPKNHTLKFVYCWTENSVKSLSEIIFDLRM